MFRMLILVTAPGPGAPSSCLKFNPAILPASAPDVTGEDERTIALLCTVLIAPVNVGFFIPEPYPVTTISSITLLSETKRMSILEASLIVTSLGKKPI